MNKKWPHTVIKTNREMITNDKNSLKTYRKTLECFCQKHISKQLLAVSSQSFLLLFTTMILKREYHRKFTCDKRCLCNCFNNVLENENNPDIIQ